MRLKVNSGRCPPHSQRCTPQGTFLRERGMHALTASVVSRKPTHKSVLMLNSRTLGTNTRWEGPLSAPHFLARYSTPPPRPPPSVGKCPGSCSVPLSSGPPPSPFASPHPHVCPASSPPFPSHLPSSVSSWALPARQSLPLAPGGAGRWWQGSLWPWQSARLQAAAPHPPSVRPSAAW